MPTEASLERAVVRICRGRGVLCWKAETMAVGAPDRILIAPGGKVRFVELKAPGGRLSPHQQKVHEMLRGLGVDVAVIRDIEALKALLEEWLQP